MENFRLKIDFPGGKDITSEIPVEKPYSQYEKKTQNYRKV